ncbi:MAG: hypothetical protein H7061_00895, partial [Bdellovibrionaceae bacterium]|nr:hypothetical protein [Bdellovibrio sp.]
MRNITLVLILSSLISVAWSQEDQLGEFIKSDVEVDGLTKMINEKGLSVKPAPIKEKTVLDPKDQIAVKIVSQNDTDLTNVEFSAPPSAADMTEYKNQYAQTLRALTTNGTKLFLKTDLTAQHPIFSVPGFAEEDCSRMAGCSVLTRIPAGTEIISLGESDLRESLDEMNRPKFTGFIKIQYKYKNG